MRRLVHTTLLILFVLLLPTVEAQTVKPAPEQQVAEKPMVVVSPEELEKFFRWVMGLVDNQLEVNKNLPIWTKDRLQWVIKQTTAKQLIFNLGVGRVDENKTLYGATAGFMEDGTMNIELNMSLMTIWFWDNYKDGTPVDPARVNDLIIMLSHEVIHLKHGSDVLHAVATDLNLREEEEKRTWVISVLEDIRPLLRKGEKMNEHFVQASEALAACKGDPECPVFVAFIKGHTKK